MKLWSDVVLIIFRKKKVDLAKSLVEKQIIPVLQSAKNCDALKYRTFELIGPSLFIYHADHFKKELEGLEKSFQDKVIDSTINFILSKVPPSEVLERNQGGYINTYNEFLDVCSILSLINNDSPLYSSLSKICESIIISRLPTNQKNELKRRLLDIIEAKLPNRKDGIKHEGYKIVAKAKLLSIDIFNKQEFEKLVTEARKINNLSDMSLVFCYLFDSKGLNKSRKMELIDESLIFAKQIPSNYDKFNRIDAVLTSLLGNEKDVFKSKIKEHFNDFLTDKDAGVNSLTSLVDLAQEYDSKLAESLVSIIDTDPARRKLKEPLLKRIGRKEIRKKADDDFHQVSEIKPSLEIAQFAENKLAQLNAGKFTCKELKETLYILENISTLPLEDSYSCAAFFIANAIKKYQNTPKGKKLLNSIFTATVENTMLVDLLSTDSIIKMRNKYDFINIEESNENPRLSFNDREKAIEYLRDWIEKYVESKTYIIDPYFTENDLFILLLFKEIKPDSEIIILTSKESNNNCYDNNEEVYQNAWEKISTEAAPNTRIEIIWFDLPKGKSPIHDRCWITSDFIHGLSIGTSINSMGKSKESQINQLNDGSIKTHSSIIKDYIIDRISLKDGKRIKYSTVNL